MVQFRNWFNNKEADLGAMVARSCTWYKSSLACSNKTLLNTDPGFRTHSVEGRILEVRTYREGHRSLLFVKLKYQGTRI